MLETGTHCIYDEVTDAGNEFTECQTPRKKLQSIGISPICLHAVPQHSKTTNANMKLDKVINTINSDISEAYKVQVECLQDSKSDSFEKNDMKKKANELVRLREAMRETLKIASYSEQIQIFTLVPGNWSRK